VFAAIAGGSFIIAQRRPDARHLVRRHARTNARAIDQYSARGRAGSHQVGHLYGDIGVVGRRGIVYPHVADGEPERFHQGPESFLETETAVVRPDGDGLIGRGDRGTLLLGHLQKADSAGRRQVARRPRDDGANGNPPVARGRHIFGGDHAAHRSCQLSAFSCRLRHAGR